MLRIEEVHELRNILLYMSNLSFYQFESLAHDVWGERGDHMANKWLDNKENVWNFFVSLDSMALSELIEWSNSKNSFCYSEIGNDLIN